MSGIILPANFTPTDSRPSVQAFVKAYRAKYNEDPDYFAAQAYDTMKLVAYVIQQAGPDRKEIKDELSKVKWDQSIIYGTITFGTDRRVANPTRVSLVVQNGKFVVWNGKKQ